MCQKNCPGVCNLCQMDGVAYLMHSFHVFATFSLIQRWLSPKRSLRGTPECPLDFPLGLDGLSYEGPREGNGTGADLASPLSSSQLGMKYSTSPGWPKAGKMARCRLKPESDLPYHAPMAKNSHIITATEIKLPGCE